MGLIHLNPFMDGRKEKTMVKAYWKGREVYQIGETCSGWAQISFYANDYESPLTGTGSCWVSMDEIILEAA